MLDTLWVDLDGEKLVLVWRGTADVRSPKLKEIERILVVAEPLSAPRPTEDYRKLREELLAREEEDFEAGFADMDTTADDAAFDQDIAEAEKEFADLEQTLAQLEEEPARLASEWRAALIAEGLNPSVIVEEPGSSLAELRDAFAKAMDHLHSEGPPEALALMSSDSLLEEFDATTAEMVQLEADAASLDLDDGSTWTREAVIAARDRRESMADVELAELDLSDLDLSELDFAGADFTKANLTRTRLTRANLSRADLSGADLSEADLTEAILDGADLANAQVKSATFIQSSLADADLSGLDLHGLDFTACHGSGADFSRCQLEAPSSPGPCFLMRISPAPFWRMPISAARRSNRPTWKAFALRQSTCRMRF